MTKSKENEQRLLYRYDRYLDGSIRLARPYVRGSTDDVRMNKFDCLAFESDLSALPPTKRQDYLDFEAAYVHFYRVWTGSASLSSALSLALDRIQRDMEMLRKELNFSLEEEKEIQKTEISVF